MTNYSSRYNALVAAGISTPEAAYEATFAPDFAFDIRALDEPELGASYFVRVYDPATLETLDRYTIDDPYGDVEAAREVQAIPLEERWDLYAERGW